MRAMLYVVLSLSMAVGLGVSAVYTNTHYLIAMLASLLTTRFIYQVLYTRR